MSQCKRTVIFFLPNLQMGGAEYLTVSLTTWLAEQASDDLDIHVHVQSPKLDQLRPALARSNVTLHDGWPGLLRVFWLTLTRPARCTLVAATETYPVLWTSLASRLNPSAQRILWLHTDPARYFGHVPRFGTAFRRLAARAGTQVVCVSSAVAEALRGFMGDSTAQAHVIHNALSEADAAAVKAAGRASVAPPADLGSIGRLSPEKGSVALLKILQDAPPGDALEALRLHLFTDMQGQHTIAQSFTALRDSITVHTGSTRSEIYARVGSVAITSHFEGFSLVCLEAMTAGLHIVYRRELSAVQELLDIVGYPVTHVHPFSTDQELADMLERVARLPVQAHPEAELSRLTFAVFSERWASLLGAGDLQRKDT